MLQPHRHETGAASFGFPVPKECIKKWFVKRAFSREID